MEKEGTVVRLTRFTHPCRHGPESWPGIERNAGPACSGIVARHGAEYAGLFAVAEQGQHGLAIVRPHELHKADAVGG
uniref:hypothetical protein n=1 Tax=Metallibacterium sp. TaxID=2940281 RepID=UPI0026200111